MQLEWIDWVAAPRPSQDDVAAAALAACALWRVSPKLGFWPS